VDIDTFYRNTLTAKNIWYKMDVSQLDSLCDVYFKESQRKKANTELYAVTSVMATSCAIIVSSRNGQHVV
jgi:hypothetical protein